MMKWSKATEGIGSNRVLLCIYLYLITHFLKWANLMFLLVTGAQSFGELPYKFPEFQMKIETIGRLQMYDSAM